MKTLTLDEIRVLFNCSMWDARKYRAEALKKYKKGPKDKVTYEQILYANKLCSGIVENKGMKKITLTELKQFLSELPGIGFVYDISI